MKRFLETSLFAAKQNLGGSWRMPTKAEWQELTDNCTLTVTTLNGVSGRFNGRSVRPVMD